MFCPVCKCEDTHVRDSRLSEDGSAVRRRRFCPSCQHKFTTFERMQLQEFFVIKKTGEQKIFNRDKITASINIATRKLNISPEIVDKIVSDIVRRIEQQGESVILSSYIGELVMDALSQINQVAYVRYASVYREFRAVNDFNDFVKKLQNKSFDN